jgi:hypothetical protein
MIESGVKHHNPNPYHLIRLHFTYQKFDSNIGHKRHIRKQEIKKISNMPPQL